MTINGSVTYERLNKIPEFYYALPDGDFESRRITIVYSEGPNAQYNPCIAFVNSNASAILFPLNNSIESVEPKTIWSRVQRANEKNDIASNLYNQGDFEEAEAIYWESLKIWPTPEAYLNLARILFLQNKYEDVELICRRAIRTTRVFTSNGNIYLDEFDIFAIAFLKLGFALSEQGKFKETESAFKKSITINPNDTDTYYNLGIVLSNQNRQQDAEDAYLKAVTINPNNADAYSNLGRLLRGQNRIKEAENAYHKAITANPNSAIAYYNLGNLFYEQGRLSDAEKAWHRATTIEPGFALAYNNLGFLLADQNRLKEAFDAYRKAITADPSLALAYFNLAKLLYRQGYKNEAESMLAKAIQIDPSLG